MENARKKGGGGSEDVRMEMGSEAGTEAGRDLESQEPKQEPKLDIYHLPLPPLSSDCFWDLFEVIRGREASGGVGELPTCPGNIFGTAG